MANIILIDTISFDDLIATNVAADGASEWNPATTYTDEVVKVSYTEASYPVGGGDDVEIAPVKLYECIDSGSTNDYPPDNPAIWLDRGATNRWAMFDLLGTTQTENSNTIEVTIDASDMEVVAFFNLSGLELSFDHVDSTGSSSGSVLESVTVDLQNRNTLTWTDYFFREFEYTTQYVHYLATPHADSELQITIDYTGGTAKCGQCLVGTYYDIGDTQFGVKTGIDDFSKRETDAFGEDYLVQGNYLKKLNANMVMPASTYDAISRFFAQTRATACIVDMNGSTTSYEMLQFFGYIKEFKPTLRNISRETYKLEVKGLI